MKKFYSAIHYLDARPIPSPMSPPSLKEENLSIPDNLRILVTKACSRFAKRKQQAAALGCSERTLFRYIKNYNL